MKRIAIDYINDIIDAGENCADFITGIDYSDFSQDKRTLYAVIRAIEVMGEAVKNVPDEVKHRYPDVPWKNVAGMRDKLIHAYFGIDAKRIWITVNEEIPPLVEMMKTIRKDLDL